MQVAYRLLSLTAPHPDDLTAIELLLAAAMPDAVLASQLYCLTAPTAQAVAGTAAALADVAGLNRRLDQGRRPVAAAPTTFAAIAVGAAAILHAASLQGSETSAAAALKQARPPDAAAAAAAAAADDPPTASTPVSGALLPPATAAGVLVAITARLGSGDVWPPATALYVLCLLHQPGVVQALALQALLDTVAAYGATCSSLQRANERPPVGWAAADGSGRGSGVSGTSSHPAAAAHSSAISLPPMGDGLSSEIAARLSRSRSPGQALELLEAAGAGSGMLQELLLRIVKNGEHQELSKSSLLSMLRLVSKYRLAVRRRAPHPECGSLALTMPALHRVFDVYHQRPVCLECPRMCCRGADAYLCSNRARS